MYITFIRMNPYNLEHIEHKWRWVNDQSINYLFLPCFEPPQIQSIDLADYQDYSIKLEQSYERYDYMIMVDQQIVGEVSLVVNPEYLYYNNGATGWISIVIGETNYRGIGIGKIAISFIERIAKSIGLNRIELGVFEFNDWAIHTYINAGYQQIGKIYGFTYYNGNWWDDFRYEKYIN